MKKYHQNLKLIIPSKENELFSISKYQKKSLDTFTNSFFSTKYDSFQKTKYFLSSSNNNKKFRVSLNETGTILTNKTKNNTTFNTLNNNKLLQIPYPSFSKKNTIPAFYKNSTKLVKYPKIQRGFFTLTNYNKTNPKNKENNEKLYNTFFDSKMNAETQTYSENKNTTYYKVRKDIMNIKLSPIKKRPKVKYSYKLYKVEKLKNMKNELKKKYNINNFDTILNNIIRLIEIRDENNKGIKYTKVTNLLLDEIYNLIEIEVKKKEKKIKKSKYKSISTSMSQKKFQRRNIKLDSENEEIRSIRDKIRFKTYIPKITNFQIKYSFNSDTVNKVEDKELYQNNNLYYDKNKQNKDNIIRDDISEIDDDSDNPDYKMKSKYNLFSQLKEKMFNQKRNPHSINNINTNIGNINNNKTINYNLNFGKTNNNFINQESKRTQTKTNNLINKGSLNIKDLIFDIESKTENKNNKKNIKEDKGKYRPNKRENIIKDNPNKKKNETPNKKELIQYEKLFKNPKLINLMKQFSKFDNIDEEDYKDDYSEIIDEDKEDFKKSSINKENEFNILEDYIDHKNMSIGNVKKKIRKAKTMVVKNIDFCIEIIKNICSEIKLLDKDKEELFTFFHNLKNISTKTEISKNEQKLQNKALKTLKDFIKKYLIDIQKTGLIHSKNKIQLSKYFKEHLNNKLKQNFQLNSDNNLIISTEKPVKNKKRRKPKNAPKKKLIYDNSYFFKKTGQKDIPLKLNISTDDIQLEQPVKSSSSKNSPCRSTRNLRQSIFRSRRNAIKKEKMEGLKLLTPIEGKVPTEEEIKIEKENLLDRRLKAFFDEIKLMKNIKSNNNIERLNYLIDKEMEKFDYTQNKTNEMRKYNFYEELKITGFKTKKENRKFNAQRYLTYKSPLIFNMHNNKI